MTDIHPSAIQEKAQPVTAEEVLNSLLKSNAADLSRADGELRSAHARLKSATQDVERLRSIREGLQAGRQAVLAGQGAQTSPSA